MTIYAVFNDASLELGADAEDDGALLEALARSFLALRGAVAAYDEERVLACVPEALFSLTLPGGMTLSAALSSLQHRARNLAGRLRLVLTQGPWFDPRGTVYPGGQVREGVVTFQGVLVPALQAAWVVRGLCWSAGRGGWQTPELLVSVIEGASTPRDEALANVWSSVLVDAHRLVLGQSLAVLPAYEDPGHHDPSRPDKYDPEKSHIPKNAMRILRHAVPDESGTIWWARCEHGFYHRYKGSLRNGRLVVHWNGTTNRNATGNQGDRVRTTESHVPADVKDRLEELGRVQDCGCREV